MPGLMVSWLSSSRIVYISAARVLSDYDDLQVGLVLTLFRSSVFTFSCIWLESSSAVKTFGGSRCGLHDREGPLLFWKSMFTVETDCLLCKKIGLTAPAFALSALGCTTLAAWFWDLDPSAFFDGGPSLLNFRGRSCLVLLTRYYVGLSPGSWKVIGLTGCLFFFSVRSNST